MRITILSDIHGNLPALDAVLRDLPPDVEQIWCLGDVVNYYAHPLRCIAALRADPRTVTACWLLGNHDAAVIGVVEPARINQYGQATLAYTREQLTSDDRAFLCARPLRCDLILGMGMSVTLVHGSPADPLWHYLRTPDDAALAAEHMASPLCIVGHTHVAQAFVEQDGVWQRIDAARLPHHSLILGAHRLIVNVGSVGQPRDGNPDAAYLLLDPEQGTISFRRCSYPVVRAQQAAWHRMGGVVPPALLEQLVGRLSTAR
jgi:predicted phosphodiesterase